jgi:glycosyltransferase involved in cell wall biosynthesis
VKILLVTSSFPRWDGDWAGVFLQKLALALREIGNKVTVLAPHSSGAKARESSFGIEIRRFRYFWPESFETLTYGQGILYNLRKNPLRLFLLVPFILAEGFSLRRLVKNVDIVNVHWLLPQGLVARFFRVPSVLTLHGSDVNLNLGLLGRHIFRYSTKNSIKITANSLSTMERLKGFVPDLDVRVIPMGVDTESFRRKETKKQKDKKEHIKILSIGRLIPLKGYLYLISAVPGILKKLPGASLTIVGDGPDRESLEAHARNIGVSDSVRFTGEVETDRIPEILWDHDIFVLPSIVTETGETEGLGTVLLEAMSAGLPVIGTDVGGIPDIIEDGENGLLVPERSPEAIRDAVLTIAGDERLRERLTSAASRDVRERFSWGVIAKKFDNLFREYVR